MSVSCSCEFEAEGRTSVGEPKDMICRTPRKCNECGEAIEPGNVMYRYNMYDWETYRTVAPHWMCESCGDLMLSILEKGYCFYLGDIKGQWRDYVKQNNRSKP